MCMEDIRLGRRTRHVHRVVTIPATSVLLIDRDSMRTQLVIMPPVSGTLTLNVADSVTANAGITLTNASHPIEWTVETHGDLVQNRISAIHSTGGVNVFVSEGRLLDK